MFNSEPNIFNFIMWEVIENMTCPTIRNEIYTLVPAIFEENNSLGELCATLHAIEKQVIN